MSGKKILAMGNEAIALGAIRAGVRMAAGYPGTPSTEILETIAKHNDGRIHVEWSVNEKAAMEVGAGAAYAGARTLVTMKQVGLNVASDPLMSLAYMGVKGGMVVVSADDPGPISSQTEQDTRTFAQFAKLPVFDPSSPEEAYRMIGEAFDFSEKYATPVLFRPTTRVCHACASIELLPDVEVEEPEGFIKDTMRWVIFPRTSYQNHVYMRQVENPYLQKLIQMYFVDNQAFIDAFKQHSAAKTVHHSFVGGLLEHTLGVVRLCDFYVKQYPFLKKDLLFTAALFHDVGKLKEISNFPENDYTDDGQLLGHIIMGSELVGFGCRHIKNFPKKLISELQHCILSHHGELEFGSPKKPALPEALALTFADNTDAKLETMREILKAAGENHEWLGYNRLFESNLRKSTEF